MSNINYKALATDWIDAWNKRDIDRIVDHYADTIEFYSPTVIKRWKIEDGKLTGKEKLKQHFLKGFEEAPDLHFEFVDILIGTEGVMILYKRETGKLIVDHVILNDSGKATLVKAYYGTNS